jgi:hypothetical protein
MILENIQRPILEYEGRNLPETRYFSGRKRRCGRERDGFITAVVARIPLV